MQDNWQDYFEVLQAVSGRRSMRVGNAIQRLRITIIQAHSPLLKRRASMLMWTLIQGSPTNARLVSTDKPSNLPLSRPQPQPQPTQELK